MRGNCQRTYFFEQLTIDNAERSYCDHYSILFTNYQTHDIHLKVYWPIIPISFVENLSKAIILFRNNTIDYIHSNIFIELGLSIAKCYLQLLPMKWECFCQNNYNKIHLGNELHKWYSLRYSVDIILCMTITYPNAFYQKKQIFDYFIVLVTYLNAFTEFTDIKHLNPAYHGHPIAWCEAHLREGKFFKISEHSYQFWR